MSKTLKIVLTGAESTGKSTLSEKLAAHYQVSWIPEFSRSYVENLQRKYTYSDIEYIAKHQMQTENELSNQKIIFFDTWLIITKVWFDFVYGKHPEWLHQAILNSTIDLFLVCDVDMPWIADPLRENGGTNRQILHDIYLNELKQYNFAFEIISGTGEERMLKALEAVNRCVQKLQPTFLHNH
ncbi:MAG: AAA family ATPase [Prolixibacteraceae bacterium]